MEYRELLSLFFFVSFFAIVLVFFLAQSRQNEAKLHSEKEKLNQDKDELNSLLARAHEDNAGWKRRTEAVELQNTAKNKELEDAGQRYQQLYTELSITRQLCAEMPATKQRVLELERTLAVEYDRFNRLLDIGLTNNSLNQAAAEDDSNALPPLPVINAGQSDEESIETGLPITSKNFDRSRETAQLLQFKLNQAKRRSTKKQQWS